MAESRTYTGKVVRLRHLDNPRRRRPLVSGQIRPDHRWRRYRFEAYDDPRYPLQNQEGISFELDANGKPINVRKAGTDR